MSPHLEESVWHDRLSWEGVGRWTQMANLCLLKLELNKLIYFWKTVFFLHLNQKLKKTRSLASKDWLKGMILRIVSCL